MQRLIGYFLRGLVLIAPVAITVYVSWWLLTTIDGLIELDVPGAGFAITIGVITLVGFLAQGFVTRRAIAWLDRQLERLPIVRLLYGSIRDLLNAFVGEKRRFEHPVSVRLDAAGGVHLLGFVTQDDLTLLGLPGHVSVYCPHSYNFSGQLVIVPADRVTRLERASADVMAFIVSGGVTGTPALPPTGQPPGAH
jgi:uncharacterized membrane protein